MERQVQQCGAAVRAACGRLRHGLPPSQGVGCISRWRTPLPAPPHPGLAALGWPNHLPLLPCTCPLPQKKQALRITVSDDDLISASVEGVALVPLDGAGEAAGVPVTALPSSRPWRLGGALGCWCGGPAGGAMVPGGHQWAPHPLPSDTPARCAQSLPHLAEFIANPRKTVKLELPLHRPGAEGKKAKQRASTTAQPSASQGAAAGARGARRGRLACQASCWPCAARALCYLAAPTSPPPPPFLLPRAAAEVPGMVGGASPASPQSSEKKKGLLSKLHLR